MFELGNITFFVLWALLALMFLGAWAADRAAEKNTREIKL